MMTPTVVLGAILVVVVPAVAGGGADQAAGAGLVSLELDETRLSRVLKEIEEASGLRAELDKALAKISVSLSVEEIRWDRLAALLGHALRLDEAAAGRLRFPPPSGRQAISALDITQCHERELDGSVSFTILRFTSEDDFSSLTVKDMGPEAGFVRIRRCGEGHQKDTTASAGGGPG
jgi:hypothetical protein